MGLDLVEIMIRVEERFGISIPDEEVPGLLSAGHLHDVVVHELFGRRVSGCPTRAAFYRLRRGLVSVLGVERRSVRPSTAIAELIPRRSRRRTWKLLRQELALNLPPLLQPDSVIAGRFVWACAAVTATACLLGIVIGWRPAIGLGLLSVVVTALVGYAVSTRLATLPWLDYQTVGGLAEGVVRHNYEAFAAAEPSTDQYDEVWEAIRDVVAISVGVKREKISRGSRFVEDLGASF